MTRPFHTKTFKSGNSVAVRLPKGFDIPEGVEVELDKTGGTVTLRLLETKEEAKARMLRMLDELAALPKPPTIQVREPIEFPKRRGL